MADGVSPFHPFERNIYKHTTGLLSGVCVETNPGVFSIFISAWISMGNPRHAQLYTAGSSPSEFVARIVRGRDGEGILLDITSRAVQSGLLDVCVLAAILFSSGRSLD